MKRLLVSMATVGLLLGLAAGPVSAAPGGVARNQVSTNNYTLFIGGNHTYIVSLACGGVLWVTGWQWGSGGPTDHSPDEIATATLSPDRQTIYVSAEYVGGYGGFPLTWQGSWPVAGGTGNATVQWLGGQVNTYVFDVVLNTTTVSTYKNHGDYVSSMGGGSDAAHSCIGMPMK